MGRLRLFLVAAVVALGASYEGGAVAATSDTADYNDAGAALTALNQASAALTQAQGAVTQAQSSVQRIRERNAPTAEPPAEEPPAEPDGEVLFRGDQINDFPYRYSAAPDRITEVPDPLGSGETVFKLTVADSDTVISSNPRAQLESPTFVTAGLEFWWTTKVLIPSDYPAFNGWLTLMAIYGSPYRGSGPFHVSSWGKTLEWEEHPWSMPLLKGQWLTFLWHCKFAENGWAELWVNGVQQTFNGQTRLNTALMNRTNNGGPNNIRISQYREKGSIPGKATIYYGPLVAGTTRSAVGG